MAKEIFTDLDMKSVSLITNLPNPTAAQHAATKSYVDGLVEGLNWKDNVRVASTANINLASPGATIDGVTMSSGDRVLIKDQTAPAENGLYIWNGDASAMTRSNDASTATELLNATVSVDEGTAGADTTWRQDEIDITLETDNVVFVAFGTAVPDASETVKGKIELATQAEADTGTDDLRAITPLKMATWSGRKLKFSAQFGDGSATQYDITHNLGTRDVEVRVYRNSSPYDEVICENKSHDTNTVRLNFTVAPTTNQFRVVIVG